MKNIARAAGFSVLILTVLSCSLAGKLVNKGLDKELNTQRVGSLWSDVPRMDGLNDSPTEDLPVAIKLVLHTFVNMVINSDKNSKQTVSTDWIFYNYSGTAADVKNFYSPEKMKSSGNWSLPAGLESPCMDGKEKGVDGYYCIYNKTENGKQQGLIILALPTKDPKTPVFVYFMRAETEAEATPQGGKQ